MHRRFVALLASLVLAACIAAVPGGASAAGPFDGPITFYNPRTGLCVGIQNQGTHVGQRAVGTVCKGDHTDQIWVFDSSPTGGKGGLVTQHTGMCLDTATSSTAGNPNQFAAVVQWICNATLSQRWQPIGPIHLLGDPTDYYELQNQYGGMCLELTSLSSGYPLQTNACSLGPDFLNFFIVIPR